MRRPRSPTSSSDHPTPTAASGSAADLDDLFSRRLLFVTGKGGTGKSTIAAAVALTASRRGVRTLACEMDAKGSLAASLGAARPGYSPVEVSPHLRVMTMDTEASLREYLRVHLRLPVVAKIGPLAAMFDFVADAAPGVREVLSVGKVCWEVREARQDLVVVDAEASGHVVSQIAAPRVINGLVPRGPLRDQTRWMLDILDDPARCGVLVVTTAEDMAVTETIDLVARLRAETHTDIVGVVANGVEGEPLASSDREAVRRISRLVAAESARWPHQLVSAVRTTTALLARHDESVEQLRRLRAAVAPLPVWEVPRIALSEGDAPNTVVSRIAEHLGAVVQ